MKTKEYPMIYKRTKTGAIQTWRIIVEGNGFYTVDGQIDGVKTTSKPTTCYGKNIGKANETSDEDQAIAEAEAKMKKKLETGYSLTQDNIDTCRGYFEAQLAKKYVDYKDELTFPVLASKKIDGARMIVTKDGAISRNGKVYVSCPHIVKALAPFFKKYPNGVIDGEIYSHEVPFEQVMSLVKKTKPTSEDLIQSEKFAKLWIFDGILDNQNEGFQTRFESVKKALADTVGNSKYFVFVENELVKNHSEVQKVHDKFVAEGYEGVMIRIPIAPYENKRSKFLLKYKAFQDDEFEILEIVEGSGNRAGMAGNLVVQNKDGQPFGSGIRGGEEYYTKLWKERKNFIGKKATIRYQELTEKNIPRFPVAINIDRFDI